MKTVRKCMPALIVALLLLIQTSAVFAEPNPDVSIVNPVAGRTIYSDNLLVSVKITAASSVKVYVTQEFKVVNGENTTVGLDEYQKADKSETAGVAVGSAESFTSVNNLSFYTKKVEDVKPGIYKITVDTVDAEGKVIYTNSNLVEIMDKGANPEDPAVLDSQQQSAAALFLKNLLKIIFKD